MAFDRLQPHLETIVAARKDGKTLAQVADLLEEKFGITTTPGTLSRFLKAASPANDVRPATPDEEKRLEVIALLTEVLADGSARAEEQRVVIEHLAGKVALTGAQVEELERTLLTKSDSASKEGGVSATLLTQIWTRAFLITGLFWAIVFVVIRLLT